MSIKLKGIQVPGMTETEKITGFGIKDNPSDPSPVVVWKGSANLTYNGTIPAGSTVVGLGEYDVDTNYTVTFTADSKYVYTAKSATTTGNPGSWTETSAITIQGASYYTNLTYSGIADDDITFTVTPAHYRNVSITIGNGLKQVFFSKNLDGSSPLSGTSVNIFDGIIYAFAKLDVGYNAASDWTLVSGTADSENAIYRVASDNSLVDYNFGTINAVIKAFTITWKYLSAYPDTWTTEDESYNYGAIPSHSDPATVTLGPNQKVFNGNWKDKPAAVISDVTVEAQYTLQYYVNNVTGFGCIPDKTAGWYDEGTIITWTAMENNAFNLAGTQTTITEAVNMPRTYSQTCGYVNVTELVGTNCSTDFSTGWCVRATTITWTANTNYAFAPVSEPQFTETTTAIGGVNRCRANIGYYTVECSAYATANNDSGWYEVTNSKSTTFTADSRHSFNGSTVSDTLIVSAPVPGTVSSGDPNYVQDKISGTRCSITVNSEPWTSGTTGLVAVGSTITWTANSGYSFSAGTTQDATRTATVNLKSYFSSKSADYKNITITSTRCTCDTSDGYRQIGNTIIWTAGSDTNVQYSFENTSNTIPVTAKTETISTSTSSYSANAQYNYFYVNVSPSTGFTADYSSGWQYIKDGVNVTFTVPTPTATRKISFSDAYSTTSTATTTCSSAGQTISEPTNYVWMNCAFTGNNCSANISSGWYVCGTNITWTANSNSSTGTYCSFSNSSYTETQDGGVVTDDTTIYSASADYIYYQITVYAASGCSVTTNGTGKYLKNSNVTTTWTVSDTNTKTFNPGGTAQTTATSTWIADDPKEITSPTVYTRTYAVSITASTGVSSVYSSTSYTATTGNSSGTRYSYNATVYGFAVLAEGYNAPSGWVLVSGTANTTGAKYRVDSTTTTQDRDFGNISANVKTFTITVNSHSFGTIYLNDVVQSGSSFTANYWDTIKVNLPAMSYRSTIYESLTDPTLTKLYNSSSGYYIRIKNNFPRSMDIYNGSTKLTSLSNGNTYDYTNLSSNTNYTLTSKVASTYTDNYTKYGYSTGSGYTYNTTTSSKDYSWTVKDTYTISWNSAGYGIGSNYTYEVSQSIVTGKQLSSSASKNNISEKTCRVTFKNTTTNRVDSSKVTISLYYKTSRQSGWYHFDLVGNGASRDVDFSRDSYVGGSSYTVYYYASSVSGSGDASQNQQSLTIDYGNWS